MPYSLQTAFGVELSPAERIRRLSSSVKCDRFRDLTRIHGTLVRRHRRGFQVEELLNERLGVKWSHFIHIDVHGGSLLNQMYTNNKTVVPCLSEQLPA